MTSAHTAVVCNCGCRLQLWLSSAFPQRTPKQALDSLPPAGQGSWPNSTRTATPCVTRLDGRPLHDIAHQLWQQLPEGRLCGLIMTQTAHPEWKQTPVTLLPRNSPPPRWPPFNILPSPKSFLDRVAPLPTPCGPAGRPLGAALPHPCWLALPADKDLRGAQAGALHHTDRRDPGERDRCHRCPTMTQGSDARRCDTMTQDSDARRCPTMTQDSDARLDGPGGLGSPPARKQPQLRGCSRTLRAAAAPHPQRWVSPSLGLTVQS